MRMMMMRKDKLEEVVNVDQGDGNSDKRLSFLLDRNVDGR